MFTLSMARNILISQGGFLRGEGGRKSSHCPWPKIYMSGVFSEGGGRSGHTVYGL